jgi:hypothetical protein
MERYKKLRTEQIKECDYNVIMVSKIHNIHYETMCQKFGQLRPIIVCEEEDEFRVVDGNKSLKTYKKLGFEFVLCFNLGYLSDLQKLAYRVLLNCNLDRLDYIGLAKIVNQAVKNSKDIPAFSNKSGLSIDDVERYLNLLDFDWDMYLKQEPNFIQKTLF